MFTLIRTLLAFCCVMILSVSCHTPTHPVRSASGWAWENTDSSVYFGFLVANGNLANCELEEYPQRAAEVEFIKDQIEKRGISGPGAPLSGYSGQVKKNMIYVSSTGLEEWVRLKDALSTEKLSFMNPTSHVFLARPVMAWAANGPGTTTTYEFFDFDDLFDPPSPSKVIPHCLNPDMNARGGFRSGSKSATNMLKGMRRSLNRAYGKTGLKDDCWYYGRKASFTYDQYTNRLPVRPATGSGP
ncbi:MAG: hypothetical protein ACI9TH_003452 [Kiritimatiellia bacterium]|jgi:hypothetical protein